MSWNWKVGRIRGIDIRVHATFLILLAWAALAGYAAGASVGAAARGVMLILVVFGVVVLHELAHAFTARRFGIATRDITLLPIGGISRLERMPEKPGQELAVALAGPAVNLAIAGLLFLGGVPAATESFAGAFMWINVYLGLFNLVPAFPMDGGRVLRALLATRIDRVRATEIAAALGKVIAMMFAVLGLVLNPFLLLIAVFVWIGASQEAAVTRLHAELAGVRVEQAMLAALPALSPGDSLARAVARLGGMPLDLPVIEDGRLVGMLEHRRLLEGLASLGDQAAVAELMLREPHTAEPDEPLVGALQRMQEREHATLPVVRAGRLVGLLTADAAAEYVRVQSALRRHTMATRSAG